MAVYDNYPSVDENYNFPPEIITALASQEKMNAVRGYITPEVTRDSLETGVYYLTHIANGTGVNAPATGTLWASIYGRAQVMLVGEGADPGIWITTKNSDGVWSAWDRKDVYDSLIRDISFYRGVLPDGTNLYDLHLRFNSGLWTLDAGYTYVNSPKNGSSGVLRIDSSGNASRIEAFYYNEPHSYKSYMSGIGTPPRPFTPWERVGQSGDLTGITNQILVEDWVRRRGGRKQLTTGAVSFRFDHGLNNFNTYLRPELERLGIKYSLALNSGMWSDPQNNQVTPDMVNSWVLGGLCEIWNHGKLHSGSKSDYVWRSIISDGLTELRAQIPAASVDGFVLPGTNGVGYGDFIDAYDPADFYRTAAGRHILATHAISTGQIPGTAKRLLDGVPRNGLNHYGIESASVADVISNIDSVKSNRGLQIMHHPLTIGMEGKATVAQLTEIFEYAAAERDAGRLEILGQYDLLLADTTAIR